MKTFVIAEAAACHDGSYEKANQLVKVAKSIGADAVKFQWVSNARRLADRRNAQVYRHAYENIQFPIGWLAALKVECNTVGIEFMCTVYLPEDIPVIAPLVERFKVASFESGDTSFLRDHAKYHKPLLISTGMMDERPSHVHGDLEIYWLHCVSSYPTPWDQLNLGVLRTGLYDGVSDHSADIKGGMAAVLAGAEIVEFHIRLHETRKDNADYQVALDPVLARYYVEGIRLAEQALGDGIKRIMPCEQAMLPYKIQA